MDNSGGKSGVTSWILLPLESQNLTTVPPVQLVVFALCFLYARLCIVSNLRLNNNTVMFSVLSVPYIEMRTRKLRTILSMYNNGSNAPVLAKSVFQSVSLTTVRATSQRRNYRHSSLSGNWKWTRWLSVKPMAS